jgi:hypothetical protein
MRHCVAKDGTIDFRAWECLGSDVTPEEFVQLERVANYVADMQWEQTDFYRTWSKGEGAGEAASPTPLAVQGSDKVGLHSVDEIRAAVRRGIQRAREAGREGVTSIDASDPLAWHRSKGYV